MSRISEDVWARLAAERVKGESLWTRRAMADVTERLFVALDANAQRHLLVLLLEGDEDVQDNQSRGLSVATQELAGRAHQAGRYLDITCVDATGHDALDLIGGELADRLAAGRETAPECVVRVLSKWRRFWGQLPRHILSRDAQLGLFAELWFLSVWLMPSRGLLAAAQSWRGPFGSRHDFERLGRSIEVKATTSTRGPIHRINGIDQLASPEQGDLLLFSLQLREEFGATNTLPLVISTCRALLNPDSEAVGLFESALFQIGYSPAHDEEYEKMHLRVVEQKLFVVRDDFPRLTVDRLAAGVPTGVERIEYEINLSAFDHLCIARNATDFLEL